MTDDRRLLKEEIAALEEALRQKRRVLREEGHATKIYMTLKPERKRDASFFTPEAAAARKEVQREKNYAANRSVYGQGQGNGFRQFMDEGEDPICLIQRGENRGLFNLGDGNNWRRPRPRLS